MSLSVQRPVVSLATCAAGRRKPGLSRGGAPLMASGSVYAAVVFGLTWLAGNAGHETGDFLVQGDRDARRKQGHTRPDEPGWLGDDRKPCQRVRDGHVSLARHAVTYGLTQAVTKAGAYTVAGVRVPWRAQFAGQLAEIVLHAVIDDGRLLRRFAEVSGKLGFHNLNAGGVSGRMLMDQAVHKGLQAPIGAAITTLLAARRGRR